MTLRLSQRATRRDFTRPAENAHARWATRAGSLITLESDDGPPGSGEVAPLPDFSRDTLAECERALGELNAGDLPARVAPGPAVLVELGRASARLPHSVPAARAGLEAALLDLWARAAGVPAWAMFERGTPVPGVRRVAALLMGEPELALEQAIAARARGVTAFKLKIGRAGATDRELAAFARLRAELGADVALRLDANRAWSVEQARAALPRFAAYAPELVEEPCTLAQLIELEPNTVPLALDESLAELSPDEAVLAPFVRAGLSALILKPTLLGGVSACAAWARVAAASGLAIVLSHAFEGPLGLALSATLALTLGTEGIAHGLDLEGAHLSPRQLPYFSGAQIRAWPEPGFGDWELEA